MLTGLMIVALPVVLAFLAFAGFVWFLRFVTSEVVDERDLPQHLSFRWGSVSNALLGVPVLRWWVTRKRPLLFYNRDRRGRFRRIRRY